MRGLKTSANAAQASTIIDTLLRCMLRRIPRNGGSYNIEMEEPIWDAVVIGAGAAGLMAGLRAAERGRKTLVLEKNRKAGVKILMSGGTRCNITQATDNRGIVAAYGPPGRFLHSALAALSVQQTIEFFEAEGVATKVEETGKIFPVSNKATHVLDALLNRLRRSGAVLALGEPVLEISRQGAGEGFQLTTSVKRLVAARIILTTGGQSYPGAGTTGDGYRFATQFGHRIIAPRPALVPLTTKLPWIAELRGITLPDVRVRILQADGCELAQRRGSLLFTHFGLSGPVVLDVSRVVSGHEKPETLLVDVDLLPAVAEQELHDWMKTESLASARKQTGRGPHALLAPAPRRRRSGTGGFGPGPQSRGAVEGGTAAPGPAPSSVCRFPSPARLASKRRK